MNKVKGKHIEIVEIIFKISYLFLALGTFNSYIYSSSIQPFLVNVTLAAGGITILFKIVQFNRYKKVPCLILTVLFCASMLFSAIMNRKYGMTGDLKWIIWTGFQFFGLYLCDVEKEHSKYKTEFTIVSNIMIIYACVCAVASLCMLVTRTSAVWNTQEHEKMISGFLWGRLWGVYTDPNYAAVFCVIAILLSVLFLIQKKHLLLKAVYFLSSIVNFLVLVFTDSRTGEIALLCSGGFCVFMICIHKKYSRKIAANIGIAVMAAFLLTIVTAGGVHIVKMQYNQKLSPVFAKMFPKEKKPAKSGNVGRKQDIEEDVSNGRFAIWESGFEVWKTTPIYGTGYTTFIPYTKEHLPDTYVVNNHQGNYGSLHNAFLNTLVFQGIIGFLILIAIGLKMIIYIWNPLLHDQKSDYCDMIFMTGCIVAVVVSMLFLLEGVYTNSPGSFVLWTFSGYLIHYAYRTRKEN